MKNRVITMGYGLAAAVLVLCLTVAEPAWAGDITGRACVMDGDPLMIGGKRRHSKCVEGQIVDIWGISAFPLDQLCPHPSGQMVRCGLFSAYQLQEKLKTSEIRCEEKSTKFGGIIVAQCFLDQEDIGRYMVSHGYARANGAETERYTGHEAQARSQRRGLWEMIQ